MAEAVSRADKVTGERDKALSDLRAASEEAMKAKAEAQEATREHCVQEQLDELHALVKESQDTLARRQLEFDQEKAVLTEVSPV